MTTLDRILSQVVLASEAIRDRVTGKAPAVLGEAAAGKGKGVLLTVVGAFESSWGSPAAEIAAIEAGNKWFPATIDFEAVLHKSRVKGKGGVHIVPSTESFVHLILQQKPGSIARIDIITHGNYATVGFEGEVVEENVLFSDEMDVGVIAGLKRDGLIFDDKQLPWSEVLSRFRKDAVIAIYGCKVGMSEDFIQELADEFQVTVKAFKHELKYYFPPNALTGGTIDRLKVTLDGKKNYRDIPFEIVKKPRAAP